MPILAIPMAELVERLRGHDRLGSELVFSATLPARAARTRDLAALDEPLPEPLNAALRASGVERLFSHQAEGIEAVEETLSLVRKFLETRNAQAGRSRVASNN
jgi:DEAD/DEAH box helicase domain-containing protein